jgi:hypothetical protein
MKHLLKKFFNSFKSPKKTTSKNCDNSPVKILESYILNPSSFNSFDLLENLNSRDIDQWGRCVSILFVIEISKHNFIEFIGLFHLALDKGKALFKHTPKSALIILFIFLSIGHIINCYGNLFLVIA